MDTTIKRTSYGVAALVWMAVVVGILVLIPDFVWSRWSERWVLFFWEFCWWPPVLTLALFGLRRGTVTSRICAVIAILAAIIFAFFIYGGSYST